MNTFLLILLAGGYLAGVYLLVGALVYLVSMSLDPGLFRFVLDGIRGDCARHNYSPLWAWPLALTLLAWCTLEWSLAWPWRLRWV